MQLSHAQKKFLRELGHKLKPVVQVGDAGATEALLKELNATIGHHELVKIRVRASDRIERNRIIDDLCQRSDATLVSRVGNTALLYRRDSDSPRIHLPPPG